MIIVSSVADLRRAVGTARREGKQIGFVPTMGALHAGHGSLFAMSSSNGDFVVASIFVNPLQFNDPNDLSSYPRTEAADELLCREAGVDLLFRPPSDAIYPAGFDTSVSSGAIGARLEGTHRPGHFDGVTTVVLKLFNMVQPDRAYFGQKDYQQLCVIRKMVRDLDSPVDIVGCPTVREPDGLAMSSRNVRLEPSSRRTATALYRSLERVAAALMDGRPASVARASGLTVLNSETGIDIEYLEIVDRATLLEPVGNADHLVVLVAATVGGVRLIDNVEVDVRMTREEQT